MFKPFFKSPTVIISIHPKPACLLKWRRGQTGLPFETFLLECGEETISSSDESSCSLIWFCDSVLSCVQIHKYWGIACVPLKTTMVSGLETLSTTLSWASKAPGLSGGGVILKLLPWQKEPVSTSASNTYINLSVLEVFLTLSASFLRLLVKYMPVP